MVGAGVVEVWVTMGGKGKGPNTTIYYFRSYDLSPFFSPLIGVKKSLVFRFVAEARFSVLCVAAAWGGGSLAAGDYM